MTQEKGSLSEAERKPQSGDLRRMMAGPGGSFAGAGCG